MAQTRIKVGSLSWIHQQISPVTKNVAISMALQPDWIPKTYLGLYATKNRSPSPQLDLPGYRGTKQFRAMTYAEFDVVTSDDRTTLQTVTQIGQPILDGGYTPAFDRSVFWLFKHWVPDPSMSDPTIYPGILGAGSAVVLRGRHPNTMIDLHVATSELVANGLIFFRAGDHTDRIGTDIVKCPYHVPWVWCEWLVTFRAGRFSVFGTGSVFPTHTFYAQGNSYGQQDEPTDADFVTRQMVSGSILRPQFGNPRQIVTSSLRVYPVLTTGAPANGSPQAPDTTNRTAGPAASIPFAVAGSGYTSSTTF